MNMLHSKPKWFSRTKAIRPEEEIVISGVAGRFPNARNMSEFSYNLYNKIDMIDDLETRWRHFNVEIPRRTGKIADIQKFDHTYFGIPYKQAQTMDPQMRILMEHTFEAILDAGVSPKSLIGSRTGVFVGSCYAECEKTWIYDRVTQSGLGIKGCARSFLATRLSYTFGFTGPAFILDTACSSSTHALDCAFHSIRCGECDAAIIAGTNLLIHPYFTLLFARLGVLAADGYCRPFDHQASGYTRSETVCVMFLQKAKDANRCYATLAYTKSNCDGYKEQGITYPSGEMQAELLSVFYDEINIDPLTVDYVEAHSTGTLVGDPEECNALDKTFCTGRKGPLLVGSVKSNIGHSEAASGMCSIAKAILTFQNNKIAPTIHYTKCRPGLTAIEEKRLVVVDEPTDFSGNIISINSFGFGGANAHLLLKGNPKVKINGGAPTDNIPRLVLWSGRTMEAISAVLDDVENKPIDVEYIVLLHKIQQEAIATNVFRGFGIYSHKDGLNATRLCREVISFADKKRQIAWVFSGLGLEWREMDQSLLEIVVFRNTIECCHRILMPKGLNLMKIIASGGNSSENFVHTLVGNIAIQIGLVDVLRSIQITPDFILGHSFGEIVCAYADGGLSLEQTILCAYAIGSISSKNDSKMGQIATVGMGYRKLSQILPAGIEIASHNGLDSSIISGPTTEMNKFILLLKTKSIFVESLSLPKLAYHSSHIKHLETELLVALNKIIPHPMKRSAKWLSASKSFTGSDAEESEYCSGSYFKHCLLHPVLFEETTALLPRKLISIEISAEDKLQSSLKSLLPNSFHINLLGRSEKNNLLFFLNTLGRLFNNGLEFPIANLYPTVELPVSAKTAMISPLIKWNHSEDWFVTTFGSYATKNSGVSFENISLNYIELKYLQGHKIDGRLLYPATGYLLLAWEALAQMIVPSFFDVAVEFHDIQFLRATAFSATVDVELTVMLMPGTGRFEINEGSSTVVTGFIKTVNNPELMDIPVPEDNDLPILETKDFYKELKLRGYHYSGVFQSVIQARGDGLKGKLKWHNSWVPFMDCMLQMQLIGRDSRNLLLPVGIQRVIIDPKFHLALAKEQSDVDNQVFDVYISKELNTVRSGGIEITGLKASPVSRRKAPSVPVLEKYEFIPNSPTNKMSYFDATKMLVQLGLENVPTRKVKAVEVHTERFEPLINYVKNVLDDLPSVTSDLLYLTNETIAVPNITVEARELSTHKNCMFVIAGHSISDDEFMKNLPNSLSEDGFLIAREDLDSDQRSIKLPTDFNIVMFIPLENEVLILIQYQKRNVFVNPTVLNISMEDQNYLWIDEVRTAMKRGPVLLVAENEKYPGLMGLVNCLRREPTGNLVKCVIIDDVNAPPFSLEDPLYKEQLKLGLACNVYRNGSWGSYRHLQLLTEKECKPYTGHSYVNAITPGDLSSLSWLQGSFDLNKYNKKCAQVVYASLNFRDVMLASGKITAEVVTSERLQQQCVLGIEFSGVTSTGERIMGMSPAGALASHIEFDELLTWQCPDDWTLEEAATIPVVYGTVYACFFIHTHISEGKSILIHAGSGGVGLAAIRVALAYGLDVYTTVSTEEKKQFLLDTFPALNPSHIGNSRNISFENMIMLQTEGRGVDFVLNSLADDKLQASVRCLGRNGTFLEIGKFDMANDSKLALSKFADGLNFRAVILDTYFTSNAKNKMLLKRVVQEDICRGIIKPIKTSVYPANEVEQAFRYLGSGKHVGKVLLKIRENEYDDITYPITVLPRIYCKPELSYVIPGGLGGFGLELSDWLILRGCRKIVLSSSRGISKQYQAHRIRTWEQYGVKILVNTSDITTRKGCENLINEAMTLGPVGGIFNLAVVLKDGIFENQNAETFRECMAPKATATKYLDEVTRQMCPHLQYFVIFSSVSCGRGNAGQTNYGMANSVMERIMERRHADGLPAKAIQWGAVGEVGIVADMAEDNIDMEIGGTLPQRISSCLHELDTLLSVGDPIVSSMVVAEKRLRGDGALNAIETVMNIMSIRDIKSISMDTTLSELGMDSLMAVEIKQTLERDFDLILTPQDLRSLTFSKLQEYSDAEKTKGSDSSDSNPVMVTGFAIFLTHLGEEHSSDKTILRLESSEKASLHSTVLLCPGIEGVSGPAWRSMAEDICAQTYLLQLTNTSDLTMVPEVAEFVIDDIKNMVFSNSKKFILVAHSFGALVMLEIAKLLEHSGMMGHVLLIDGAPIFLKRLALEKIMVKYDEEALQLMLIIGIIQLLFPEENMDIIRVITRCKSWEERIHKLSEFAKDQNVYSEDYIRKMITATYLRVKMAVNQDSDNIIPINSPITLIRPTESVFTDIVDDYDLPKYTTGAFTLKLVEGNHSTILENKKIAEIINSIVTHP